MEIGARPRFPLRNPSQLKRSPGLLLNVERTAAAAGAGDVRVVELESGAMQTFDVIHFGAIHIHQAGLVDENLKTVKFKDTVVLIAEVLVEPHTVLKAGAASADDLNSQAGIAFGLFVKDLLDLIFSFLRKSDRHSLFPPELNSHDLKSNRPLTRSIELGHDHALKLSEDDISVGNLQCQVHAQHQRAQM